MKEKVKELLEETKGYGPEDIIRAAYRAFGEHLTFASSLGEEDQVIMEMINNTHSQIEVFTLDTGRLFQETYELLGKTQKKYGNNIKVFYPDTEAVEDMVRSQGINLFYESIENRKLCCGIRKIQPLKRALKGKQAWITGLRRSQSVTRSSVEAFEWDEGNQLVKVNPLVNWSLTDVQAYIKEHQVDVNPLHAQGFISIGCASCTRAVKEGEDIRAGRWWWEQPEQKECGLHNNPNRPK